MNNKEIKSNVVSKIISNDDGVNAKISVARSKFNLFRPQNSNDKKIIIGGIVLIILIVISTIIIFLFSNNKKANNKNEVPKSLYEEAYENIDFKENTELKKLYCVKESLENKNNMNSKEIEIYYFKEDKIITTIFHTNIILEDNYMDYYNLMIDSYSKSLEEDYNYNNVKTDLLSKENEMLVTILVDNTTMDEKSYKVDSYTGYNDAKKSLIDSGFACK